MGEKMDPECAEYLRFLGGRIKDVRKERGLTVRDMVVGHGYHESQWRRYERGGSLTLPSLFRIAKALSLSIEVLLDGVGHYQSTKFDELRKPVTAKKATGVAKDIKK